MHPAVHFGTFEFSPTTLRLIKGTHRCRLAPQPARLLDILLKKAGQTVSREELGALLGPSRENQAIRLNSAMGRLRSILNDSGRKPRYIETCADGYCFIASVHYAPPECEPSVTQTIPGVAPALGLSFAK